MAANDPQSAYRQLPAVAALVGDPLWQGAGSTAEIRTAVCREVVAELRAELRADQGADLAADRFAGDVAAEARRRLAAAVACLRGPTLKPLINGTGVLLHTNAGRAPLPPAAIAAMAAAAAGYNTLELDAATGKRGSRHSHCAPLLRWLTGAEASLVVNNGAAAALLAVRAIGQGRPVIVSRGELVEIGGGFRVPEVIAVAGCRLHEVGTTNRTHLRDFAAAIDELRRQGTPPGMVLRVHRSNFAVIGFAAEPALADLAALCRAEGLPLVVDLGSGALAPLPIAPVAVDGADPAAGEPTAGECVLQGADVVTFSGDKLVGGPQAGIAIGRAALLAAMAKDPLARALRVGGAVLAGLQAVLRMHAAGQAGLLPALGQLHVAEDEIAAVADRWAAELAAGLPAEFAVTVEPSPCQVGGGTHPLLQLPSRALAISHPRVAAGQLQTAALQGDPPILGRIRRGQWLVDVRSVLAGLAAQPFASAPESAALAAIAMAARRAAGELAKT